jgi:hypothetical protein
MMVNPTPTKLAITRYFILFPSAALSGLPVTLLVGLCTTELFPAGSPIPDGATDTGTPSKVVTVPGSKVSPFGNTTPEPDGRSEYPSGKALPGSVGTTMIVSVPITMAGAVRAGGSFSVVSEFIIVV